MVVVILAEVVMVVVVEERIPVACLKKVNSYSVEAQEVLGRM